MLFRVLQELDLQIMEATRELRCLHCGGPLHLAKYLRKPKGNLVELPEDYRYRYSLCCGNNDCRKRTLPESSLFMGRRVAYQCAILAILTVWQNGQKSAQALSDLLGVDVRTIWRWAKYFREEYPRSSMWQKIKGRVPPKIHGNRMPGSLVGAFINRAGDAMRGIVACICFMIGKPGLGTAK